jgi:hypothetical protein
MEKRDHRTLTCPNCYEKGSVYLDPASLSYRCRKCQTAGFDPYKEREPKAALSQPVSSTATKPKKRRPRDTKTKPDPRPPIPDNANPMQVVEDTFVPYMERGFEFTPVPNATRTIVSRTYCPKNIHPNPNELFDPTTKAAQAYMTMYAKRFKNRRRYDRDLKRRAREEMDNDD